MESESQLRSSSEWREFFGSLPEKERRTLARMGIIGWIVGDE